jgi:hypothetical protein
MGSEHRCNGLNVDSEGVMKRLKLAASEILAFPLIDTCMLACSGQIAEQ